MRNLTHNETTARFPIPLLIRWLGKYNGIDREKDETIHMNIYSLIEQNNAHNLQKIACTFSQDNGSKRHLTYEELLNEVALFAKILTDSGILPGDRVALVSENAPEWNVAFLAIQKLNATSVLIDASLTGSEIANLIEHSDVGAIYTSPKIMEKLNEYLGSTLPVFDLMNKSQVYFGFSRQAPELSSNGDPEVATIIFSSGTTRSAMGIMHTHDALINSTLMCVTSNQLDREGRYLSVIPNSHVYGLVCLVLAPMLLGADSFYIESMTAPAIKVAFDSYQPTVFPCVPKVFDLFKTQALMSINSKKGTQLMFKLLFPLCLFARKRGLNLGKVIFKSIHQAFGGEIDILCSAGAPMSQETADFYLGTGFNLLITYGATETNIPTIGNRGNKLTADTCGKPYDDVEVKLSPQGELLIRSPYMMKGYFRNPVATAEAFEDGWLKTGDIGALDSKGNYRIIGRSKENIILGTGKKLTPDDVEAAYCNIPGISELVIAGVPSPNGYDEIHAFVVRDQSELSKENILEGIAGKTAEASLHMKLTKVHFIEAIPKTSLQKPKRYLLKKMALDEGTNESQPTEKKGAPLDIQQKVIQLIAQLGEIDDSAITASSKPFSELGMDSLAAINLALELEDNYHLNVEGTFHPEMSVADLVNFIQHPKDEPKQTKELGSAPKVKRKIDYILFKSACVLARVFYKVTVKNDHTIPNNTGYIICANHVSNLDYLWLTVNFKKEQFQTFYCMAKQEVVNKAAISQLLTRICGMIPINRDQVGSDSLHHCKVTLKANNGLLIHPEGTRSKSGQLGALKKGAAMLAIDSGVPIIPAYIHGAYEIYPRGNKLPKWFNFSKMRKYPVNVVYGKPIMPTGLTAKELTKQVEAAMMALAIQP